MYLYIRIGGVLLFSKRLKYLRKLRKLSQEELAKKISTTKSTISNYENEYSTPSNDVLKDLADKLDTTTDYLLGRDVDTTGESERKAIMNKIATEFPDIDLMFNDIKSWTAEEFEELYDYIKFKESQKNKGE